MLALYRSGRQAEALEAYQSLAPRARRRARDRARPGAAAAQRRRSCARRSRSSRRPPRRPPRTTSPEVVKAMLAGRLVPVLGSDVGELAARLAEHFAYPGEAAELTRVSQYVA